MGDGHRLEDPKGEGSHDHLRTTGLTLCWKRVLSTRWNVPLVNVHPECSEEKTAGWLVHRPEDLHACLSSVDAVIDIEYNQTFLCVSVASQTFTSEPLVPWQKRKIRHVYMVPGIWFCITASICVGLGQSPLLFAIFAVTQARLFHRA